MGATRGLFFGIAVGVLVISLAWVTEEDVLHPAPAPHDTAALGFHRVMTTLFWVGEEASAANENIPNASSFWDDEWQKHYGGVDDPDCRNGYDPCTFTPKENPFYFALPYAEFTDAGVLKDDATSIPWFTGEPVTGESLLKNHWIKVSHGKNICYAQWEDTGPFLYDDTVYVFGSSAPKNKINNGAGLDVSPALWTCLNMTDNDYTSWQFIQDAEVPDGPWKKIVTQSEITWR